ncbi:MAG: hypothetical protein NXI31_21775 [bacterium]|nr:hypothetical protein [bacterium]
MAIPEGLSSQLWTLATAVAAPAGLGIGIVQAFGLRFTSGRREFAGLAYLIGQLALAPLTFLWLATGKPTPALLLPGSAMLLGGALWLWSRRRQAADPAPARSPQPFDWLLMFATIACALVFVDQCLVQNFQPIMGGDEGLIWNAKARVLYCSPDFAIGFGLTFHVGNPDYPLLNPLMQCLAYANLDGIALYESRIPIQAFTFAGLMLLSGSLRRWANPIAGTAILVAVASTPLLQYGKTAMADAMLGCAMLAVTDSFLRYRATGSAVHWRLLWVSLALALAIKNEAKMLLVVFAIAATASALLAKLRPASSTNARPRFRLLPWLWAIVPTTVLLLGMAFNRQYGLVTLIMNPAINQGQGMLERFANNFTAQIGTVLTGFGAELIAWSGRWLLLLCLLAALLRWRQWREPAMTVAVFVFGALLAYSLVFITFTAVAWALATGTDRMTLHLLPGAALTLGALLGPQDHGTVDRGVTTAD